MSLNLGQIVHSFFNDGLVAQKGLLLASIRSYRDALKLYLRFVADDAHRPLTRLSLDDLTLERTLRFLDHLEVERHNHIHTRNHRLAALHSFFEYVARRVPELLPICQQISLIPVKRTAPRPMHFLEEQEVKSLFRSLPSSGYQALRNRTLLLFLYNTGARVQELCDLRWSHLDLNAPSRVRLRGKGNKWRVCPLWAETARQLGILLNAQGSNSQDSPVFISRPGHALTRFGVYKIVRRCAGHLDFKGVYPGHISPHVFRHTAAVHLLEAGVDVNVIRCWLGHTNLETTNRYAEITVRMKEKALSLCEPPSTTSSAFPRKTVWRDDESLLKWLDSL